MRNLINFKTTLLLLLIASFSITAAVAKDKLTRDSSKELPGDPLVSMVLLQKAFKPVTLDQVIRVVHKRFGVRLSTKESQAGFITAIPEGFQIYLKKTQKAFLILSQTKPYIDQLEDFANSLSDIKIKLPLLQHRAWTAIDWQGSLDWENRFDVKQFAAIYHDLALLTLEFLDDNSLLLFLPEYQLVYPIDPSIREKLGSQDPIKSLRETPYSPVYEVRSDNPEMVKAVKEAKRRWPEFVKAFRNRKDNQTQFLIKTAINDLKTREFVWISVNQLSALEIEGTLESEPFEIKNVRPGDHLKINIADIVDWSYPEGGSQVGDFTDKVIRENIP